MFDRKRHVDYMHLPIDWPRINQFPEYFVVEMNGNYSINLEKSRKESDYYRERASIRFSSENQKRNNT